MSTQSQNIALGLQIAYDLLNNAQNLIALLGKAHAENRDITDNELNSLVTADEQMKAALEAKIAAAPAAEAITPTP